MATEITMPSYFFPELLGIILLLVISISLIMPGIDRISRLFFLAFFSVLIINALVFAFDMATYKNPKLLAISSLLPFVEQLLLSLPTLLLTLFLLYSCREPWKENALFYVTTSLWGIYVILLCIAHFTTFFYYTAADGTFYLTKWSSLLYIPLIAILITALISLIIKRNRLSKRYFYAFFSCLFSFAVALILHAFFFTIMILIIALTLGAVTMYLLILTDQIEQYMRQQAAIADQNARIMVLQMRPHFIYNTMTSIYYLCEQDPKKAQQVILDFTSYLRKNFNAIAGMEPIPFSDELEHVRSYLAVEMAQFEDNLSVTYDIPHTDFRLPPLTLEPLVENAVKYCMDPDRDPLHITIRTFKTDADNVIIVSDNGPGFDPTNVFNTSHALSNIKQRLEMFCRGRITIDSTIGEGTVVTITIPHATV